MMGYRERQPERKSAFCSHRPAYAGKVQRPVRPFASTLSLTGRAHTMTVHRLHPIYDEETAAAYGIERPDPYGAVLYDQCERCTEHARQLYSLDTLNRRSLLRRLDHPRTDMVVLTATEQTVNRDALAALIETSGQ